ncbi:MAG: hypothetical protein IPM21_09955 [Acidobacteria bacterium]|nr:hypothetical protein [Acidobacteriota bacterium]
MFFRKEFTLDLDLLEVDERKSTTFSFEDEGIIRVEIRRPTSEDERIGYTKNQLFCTAILETATDKEIAVGFEHLARNKMPNGHLADETRGGSVVDYIDDDGNIKENYIVNVELLPKNFQEFQSKIGSKLSDYVRRVAKVLRWRGNRKGHHNPIQSSRGFFWSFDKTDWRRMPNDAHVRISFDMIPQLDERLYFDIETMVAAGIDEPLAHTILREASNQIDKNPRSSLVLGIVAVEVGFKQLVGTLVPGAQWLVENVPSPPLTKMLTKYLPQLPAKRQFACGVLARHGQ